MNKDKAPITVRSILWGLQREAAAAEVVQTSASHGSATLEPVKVLDGTIEVTVPAESVTRLLLRGAE